MAEEKKVRNRYKFAVELEGFIRLDKPGGKFNNMSFSYTIPAKAIPKLEEDREDLLEWAKSKDENWRRKGIKPEPWNEAGLVKVTFGGKSRNDDGEEYERGLIPIIDTSGQPVPKEVLATVGQGTKVKLVVQQKPYTKPMLGTSLKTLGMMIVELKTREGAADSGDLTQEELMGLFGETEGYVADAPAVRDGRKKVEPEEEQGDDYNDF